MNPQWLLTWTICPESTRRLRSAARSPMFPGTSTGACTPHAAATSSAHCNDAVSAGALNGLTMPVVPMMESPPSMPRRGLKVRAASSRPPGIEMVIFNPRPVTSRTDCWIIRRGAGLIAGSPGASARPGLVTVPTPSPAANRTSPPSAKATSATMVAWWVMSGSSPASLRIVACAISPSLRHCKTGKRTRGPSGNSISTLSGATPSQSNVAAALAAAAAQAPVVNPVRRIIEL